MACMKADGLFLLAGHRLAHDMAIEEYRAKPVILSFGSPAGPEVGRIVDLSVPVEDGSSIPIRVYYPKSYENGQILPAYINYHGGGECIGIYNLF